MTVPPGKTPAKPGQEAAPTGGKHSFRAARLTVSAEREDTLMTLTFTPIWGMFEPQSTDGRCVQGVWNPEHPADGSTGPSGGQAMTFTALPRADRDVWKYVEAFGDQAGVWTICEFSDDTRIWSEGQVDILRVIAASLRQKQLDRAAVMAPITVRVRLTPSMLAQQRGVERDIALAQTQLDAARVAMLETGRNLALSHHLLQEQHRRSTDRPMQLWGTWLLPGTQIMAMAALLPAAFGGG